MADGNNSIKPTITPSSSPPWPNFTPIQPNADSPSETDQTRFESLLNGDADNPTPDRSEAPQAYFQASTGVSPAGSPATTGMFPGGTVSQSAPLPELPSWVSAVLGRLGGLGVVIGTAYTGFQYYTAEEWNQLQEEFNTLKREIEPQVNRAEALLADTKAIQQDIEKRITVAERGIAKGYGLDIDKPGDRALWDQFINDISNGVTEEEAVKKLLARQVSAQSDIEESQRVQRPYRNLLRMAIKFLMGFRAKRSTNSLLMC